MFKKLFFFFAIAAISALPSAAQTMVAVYQPTEPGITQAGVTYYLPKTSFRFFVKATCITRHAGPFAEYAERFLGIEDAAQVDSEYWRLDDISAIEYGTPDDSQAYTISLNPKTSAPLVTLTPGGVLLAINDEVEFPEPLPKGGGVEEIPVDNPVASDFFSEDFLRAGSNVKKAETAAEEIYDIREKTALIASGEADFNPTDGQQLQLMLQQQRAREEALKSLFTGTVSMKTCSYSFDYTPTSPVEEEILFRFSRHTGMVDKDDVSGEPYCLTIVDETVQYDADSIVDPKLAQKQMFDLRYRIPGRAHVIVANTKEVVFEQNYFLAQFGHVVHLGGELFNKKFTTKVQFNPITGNIKKIDMATPVPSSRGLSIFKPK